MSSGEKSTVPPEAVPSNVTPETGRWTIACPQCGCDLTVDTATGQVLHSRPAKQPPAGGQDFDQLLAGLDDSKHRAEQVFQREVTAHKDRDRLMDEKFREAMRRAEEEPDPKPPLKPWELD